MFYVACILNRQKKIILKSASANILKNLCADLNILIHLDRTLINAKIDRCFTFLGCLPTHCGRVLKHCLPLFCEGVLKQFFLIILERFKGFFLAIFCEGSLKHCLPILYESGLKLFLPVFGRVLYSSIFR
jgi:hypothetical protein